jgi:hypothetical protein
LALLTVSVTELPLDEAYKVGEPAKAVPASTIMDKAKVKPVSLAIKWLFIYIFVSNVNY